MERNENGRWRGCKCECIAKTLGVHSIQKQIKNANVFGKYKCLWEQNWCIDNDVTFNYKMTKTINENEKKNKNTQNN